MKLLAGRRGTLSQVAGTLAILLITGAILGYLIYTQRDLLAETEIQVNLLPLFLVFLIFSLDLLLVAAIWGQIMNTLGEKMPVRRHIRIYLITNLAKRIPGTIWYIAGRAELYKGEGVSRRLTVGASGVEFVVALVSSGIVALVFGFSILAEDHVSFWSLALLLGLSLIGSHPRLIRWIFKKTRVDAKPFTQPQVLTWVLEYVLAWILSGLVFFTVGRAFIDLSLDQVWFFIGSLAAANLVTSLLFFLPTNLGVTEVSLSLLLSRIIPIHYAVLISVAARILIIAFEAIWAVASLWLTRLGRPN